MGPGAVEPAVIYHSLDSRPVVDYVLIALYQKYTLYSIGLFPFLNQLITFTHFFSMLLENYRIKACLPDLHVRVIRHFTVSGH
jgi:hypothetical protein